MTRTAVLREQLERFQVAIYFVTVLAAGAAATLMAGTEALERAIDPALVLMLFATFLQLPLTSLGRAIRDYRFLFALMVCNFLLVPLLVAAMLPFMPADPLVRLGIVLVLLTPCVDYVITFSHAGRADSGLLLASTPILLFVQLLLLPVFLRVFPGDVAAGLLQPVLFLKALIGLIVIPLLLAGLVQWWAGRSRFGQHVERMLGVVPVPATALVLFVVVAAVMPRLEAALSVAISAVPFYVAFAVMAPVIGWMVSRLLGLNASASRAVAFSTATRNSLVVLPLALAVPGAIPLLPAVIVAQTMVELLASLVYMRVMPKLGGG